jgi:hypothetical protein
MFNWDYLVSSTVSVHYPETIPDLASGNNSSLSCLRKTLCDNISPPLRWPHPREVVDNAGQRYPENAKEEWAVKSRSQERQW